MPAKIEDYALIGDCETAALVDKNGSIDWLCWPDFSSDACFAALLGTEENGYWKITPAEGKWETTRRYRAHTLILETTFTHKTGSFRLIDFMPVRQQDSHIVRIVQGIRGKVSVRMEMALRFDYGRTVPWVTRIKGGIRAVAGPNLAVLPIKICRLIPNPPLLQHLERSSGTIQMSLVPLSRLRLGHDAAMGQQSLRLGRATEARLPESLGGDLQAIAPSQMGLSLHFL